MKRRELTILINDYLCRNSFIYHKESSDFLKTKLEPLLHNLISCESPDMYAKIDDNILILEHFEFDGSNERRKGGMQGLSEEYKAREEQHKFLTENDEGQLVSNYSYYQTQVDYLNNFRKHFYRHYEKIPEYISHLTELSQINSNSNIITGFFIENRIPPLYIDIDNDIDELVLLYSKQFLNIFEDSKKLDFVLFGGLFGEKNRLFYIDRSMISTYKLSEIDLDKIEFLKLNEVQWTGKFTLN